MTPIEADLYRARWRRARDPLRLIDPRAEDFMLGGLAERLSQPTARLLVLPADSDAAWIEFDAAFWPWWDEPRGDPVSGLSVRWGSASHPTAEAAVLAAPLPNSEKWGRYLALHRSGGVEVGLGHEATSEHNGTRYFRLVQLVGRFWCALDLYRDAVGRFAIEGPWEVVLALRGTRGAALGGFAEGWPGPDHFAYEPEPRVEDAVLLRCEIEAWPDAEAVAALARRLGGWIEDAWGCRDRRFLICAGAQEGRFDWDRCRLSH